MQKKESKVIIFTLFFVILFLFSHRFLNPDGKSVLGVSTFKSWFGSNKHTYDLKNIVESSMVGANGSYAIVVQNLKDPKDAYALKEHDEFETGSLYKLWIMAAVFKEIAKGTLQEDSQLSEDIAVLNERFDIGSDSAEMNDGVITFTVSDALKQMITISHNYAALLLTEKIGLSTVGKFLKDEGFSESKIDPPKSTAYDIAKFFEKLYDGELGTSENSKKMIVLLKQQELNDKLPKYLPDGVDVAHKTGELGLISHDAGIIFSGHGDYVIVVLSDTDYPPSAEDRIAQLSKAVYTYFQNSRGK